MTWLYVWLGICLGYIIILNIRSIKHLKRLNELEFFKTCHSNRIEKLEKEIEELKKGNK